MYETDYNYSYETAATVAQPDAANLAIFGAVFMVYAAVAVAVTVVMIVSMWRLFEKAGKPGWAALIPVYNTIVALEIAGRPWWWVFLMFIPVANVVFAIMYLLDFVKSYGKDVVFGVLSLFFPYVMFPILAFSKDTKYLGPAGPEKVAKVS